jgi:hypothetical protein
MYNISVYTLDKESLYELGCFEETNRNKIFPEFLTNEKFLKHLN